jgi:crotonobetainyl-CoA:carnitine CoA-transferase CaiB-like acyl-CoA transferase
MEFLNGVSVLEIGDHVSASFCTKLMAALGAQVIKIENTKGGDSARGMGPFPDDEPHPEKSGLFLYLNTGKKSLTLDIHVKGGQKIFQQLIAKTDILVVDLELDILKKTGFVYSKLEKLNPRLVMTSILPFGGNGPYCNFQAEDIILQATGGLMFQHGSPDREPLKMGGDNVSHYRSGAAAFTSTLMALYQAEATGEGQHVEVSAQEVWVHDDFISIMTYLTSGEILARRAAALMLPASDGWYYIRAFPHEWPRFAQALGMPELERDERFITRDQRVKNAEELNAIVMSKLEGLTKKEIYDKLQKHKVTTGYLATVDDLNLSEQYNSQDYFASIDHPIAGTLNYPGAFATMGDIPWKHGRAPLLGEHNCEILCQYLDYSRQDLVRLRQLGVI